MAGRSLRTLRLDPRAASQPLCACFVRSRLGTAMHFSFDSRRCACNGGQNRTVTYHIVRAELRNLSRSASRMLRSS